MKILEASVRTIDSYKIKRDSFPSLFFFDTNYLSRNKS
nr:MAG TPA: hypothetical protein [Caudoviricetes sp.]